MLRVTLIALTLLTGATSVQANSASPSAVYDAYNTALKGATSWEAIFPHMSETSIADVKNNTENNWTAILGFMSSIAQDKTNFKIIKQQISGDTANVDASFCLDNIKTTEAVDLLNEGGVWKVKKVHMNQANDPC
ncbi:MAG: hypothetical protein JKY99_01030 [Rhizobiales bacterium]|nr:hypothetical protein [Hyphomicrobiales bacterium]